VVDREVGATLKSRRYGSALGVIASAAGVVMEELEPAVLGSNEVLEAERDLRSAGRNLQVYPTLLVLRFRVLHIDCAQGNRALRRAVL
jgi:hypothetical protein